MREAFWAWLTQRIGPHRSVSLRVWLHHWGWLTGFALALALVMWAIWPYVFEPRQADAVIRAEVIASAVLPSDDAVEPIAFTLRLPNGDRIVVRTRSRAIAATVGDTACVARSRGTTSGITRYALVPAARCGSLDAR